MKEEVVREILLKKNLNYAKHSTIWGTIVPSATAYQYGLKEVMHVMKNHILHFNSTSLIICPVNDNNGKIEEDKIVVIPRDKIKEVQLKVNILSFLMTIQFEEGAIQYKISKTVLACPWHKENLSYILLGSQGE